ncbi:hypothetical protein K2173_018755 [Erythroxylum novogranatense]|uniref:Srp40 C-terminal domain-containing protein n=1 Tax=Erythroxylum novogranatense TaxID=1862640 RepID=A0AAV8SAS4_9ROSI|nr:hypothetical protein K2173_018755 [Erythroxylum novogranatense]
MNINPNVLAFKPRQVQLLSVASPQIMPSDNHLLLHAIARYLEQSGLSKTLKKFRSEANINPDDLGTSSFDLEEMFRNFLETCGHANKKLESHQVQETLSNKKKKKKDDCDIDVTEKSGQEQNVDSEIAKKSPDKKCKNKKKIKSKLDSDPLADDIEPAAKEPPCLTVEKSQDGQTSEDNEVTDPQKKTKSKDKKKKKNKSSDHAVEDVHLKTDVMNASGEDVTNKQDKLSKKRKHLTSEEDSPELANENVEDSKCSRTGASKKPKVNDGESCKIPTEKHNEQANGYIETNAEHSATLSTMKKQLNDSSEPKSVKHFQRIKVDEVVFSDERLKDNSYWAKDGADTGYGAKAQEVLGQVRGRGFRHEKTKKKRGTYRGGQIDLQSHSIKFNYSDDE